MTWLPLSDFPLRLCGLTTSFDRGTRRGWLENFLKKSAGVLHSSFAGGKPLANLLTTGGMAAF
jgi:hypothetical protein